MEFEVLDVVRHHFCRILSHVFCKSGLRDLDIRYISGGDTLGRVGPPTARSIPTMTIREIGGIRGNWRPIESFGTARVSRNVDLIATGGGIGGRRAATPSRPAAPHWMRASFLYDSTVSTIVICAQDFHKSVCRTPDFH